MAEMTPAAIVLPASRSTTLPIGLQSQYNSTHTARRTSSTATADIPGARARGRGPGERRPCLSTRQTS
eukprot:scaffold1504_cov111-Isochrysis_galbana.AAC.4